MAPMTRSRAIGGLANDMIATYYQQRATAGLIVSEGISPSKNGLGYSRIPGLYNAEQSASWLPVTETLHKAGGKIFAQLMHTGRLGHKHNLPEGAELLGPSAVKANDNIWTDAEGMQPHDMPRAMSTEEAKQAIEEYADAAQYAIEGGFDGVELHSANGYLLEQFLNPHTNQRTDAYGGSVENRVAFVVATAKAVAERIGKEKTGIRLSPYNAYNDMPLYDEIAETYDLLTRELNKLDIAYVHILEGNLRSADERMQVLQTIRKNFKNALILNGGYTTEMANDALDSGMADFISFGSAFIANPNLPHKLKHNLELATPDVNTFFSAGAEGFIDYPAN